ncbi:MAG: hypothetical protein HKO93_05270, partial [Flavobacteriales bacterium]|nr:hypothetical protein [Flavobacteriales bacterium]
MGMYGYRIAPFEDLTREFTQDVSNYEVFIPDEFKLTYDGSVHSEVEKWLDSSAEDMVFIYGENDPWSATGYEPTGENNLYRFVIENGNHRSRVAHLSPKELKQFKDSINLWLNN